MGSNLGNGLALCGKVSSVEEDQPDQGPRRRRMETGPLPDDVLLEVFSIYVDKACEEEWLTLVHVCRRWRSVVFASPRRLDLQLLCTPKRPVREMLNIWPALPIIVWGHDDDDDPTSLEEGADNVIAALEHNDRLRKIDFWCVPGSVLERFVTVMQGPFPTLTSLTISVYGECPPLFPLLSGSAPRLRHLILKNIPFPASPKLLLSAPDLVILDLRNIPYSGYISPKTMATCLSAMTRLTTLRLEFDSPRSGPDRASRRLPPLTRTPLPALTSLRFKGVSDYLEDLGSQIDAPLLDDLSIFFFNQLIFHTPQLHQFISRTEKLNTFDEADVNLDDQSAGMSLFLLTGAVDRARLTLGISSSESDWQLSSLTQVCSSALASLSTLKCLDISGRRYRRSHLPDNTENTQWLELFRQFTAVKDLYLTQEPELHIAPALQELAGERVTEMLPALQNLFLRRTRPSGPVLEAIRQFVAARRLSGHPVVFHCVERGMWVAKAPEDI
ncbi:hypothetical protein BJV74DRAFT_799030 [Russula compacta]|nr:hypothetical protein BJV74DRAFT_799030 [Russula compacta]